MRELGEGWARDDKSVPFIILHWKEEARPWIVWFYRAQCNKATLVPVKHCIFVCVTRRIGGEERRKMSSHLNKVSRNYLKNWAVLGSTFFVLLCLFCLFYYDFSNWDVKMYFAKMFVIRRVLYFLTATTLWGLWNFPPRPCYLQM